MFREDLCQDYFHQMTQHKFSYKAALNIALNDILCELDHHMGHHDRSTISFLTNMRVQNCFSNYETISQARLAYHSVWLLQIGDGRIPNIQRQLYDDVIVIPQQFQVNSKEDLINHVYEDLEVNFNSTQWLSSRAILTTKNEEVDRNFQVRRIL
ncbi:ATP-dependent DNA helicase pif1-like [Octopus vulgaris]|uniref:ATP-dependent DNA helicase pif1-like n=1 Tax=Octopus vulgaris TaxID=6645 RepID=A0AA36BLK0_OCTVU|nr:ATP-dependent DNA helicase pif1-like [Octopus vulgaris]